jgi:hypothetical protein
MHFTLARDHTLASTLGHSVEFKKGVATFVPPALHDEAVAIGAVPDEELPPSVDLSNEPTDPTKRAGEVLAAIELVATRNSREDFAASGAPHVRALAVILGWKPSSSERDTLWARFQVDGAA